MPEHQQTQQSTESKSTVQKQATPLSQTPASNPYSIIQRAKINPKSLTYADVMQLQRTIGNRAVGMLLTGIGNTSTVQQAPVQKQEIPEEEEPLQGKMIGTIQRQEIPEEEEPLQGKFENKPEIACPSCFTSPIVQRQEIPEEEDPLQGKFESIQRQEIPEEEEPLQTKRENNTGMPDNLKAGVEGLSGIDMSDVRVHYNSSKPAEVGALAYTQGTNIHVAPGQEKHLPHEAWHVVQQMQGRVKPTMQMKNGVLVNDDEGMEHEADVMGAKTLENTVQRQMWEEENLLHGKSTLQQIDDSTQPISQQTSSPGLVKSESAESKLEMRHEESNQSPRVQAITQLQSSPNLSLLVAQLTTLNNIQVDENTPYPNQNQQALLRHMKGEWNISNEEAVTGGHLLNSMVKEWGPAVPNSRPSLKRDPHHPEDHVANKEEGVHFAGALPGNNITQHQHTFRLVKNNPQGGRNLSGTKLSTFWPGDWGEDELKNTLRMSFRNGNINEWASKKNTTYWYRWQTLGDNTAFPIEKVPTAQGTARNKMKRGRLRFRDDRSWSRRRFRS